MRQTHRGHGKFGASVAIVASCGAMFCRSTALAGALALAAACGGHTTQDPTTSASASLTAHQAGPKDETPPESAAPAPTEPKADTKAEPKAEPTPEPEPELSAIDAGDLRPLTQEERARFLAGEDDPLAPTEIHYVKSNEIRHDVWFPYLADLGGAYVGVASDQNYTLIAASHANLVFLMDIDQRVVDLHQIYGLLLAVSEDAETLVNLFESGQSSAAVAILEGALADADPSDRKRIVRSYKASRETVYRNLVKVLRRTRNGVPTSWLSNPEMYNHVRKLWMAGRVRTMGGDLTGSHTLQTVGKVAADLGIPIRVLYLSNAEEYFRYVPSYVANIKALGGDAQSIVLRTIYSKDWVHADALWGYQVQSLTDFQTRLSDSKNRSRNPMMRLAEKDGSLQRITSVSGLSLLAIPEAGATPTTPPSTGD